MVIGLALAMDIYVPSLPHISEIFHVSARDIQLTLTLFMLTSGIMQLIIGPLSDQFGRKITSFVTIAIFGIGTLLCFYAQSITQLVLFRIIQATGACGMLVIGFAIVRDLFSGEDSAQVYSFLNGLISFSPMFAPFIGSYLDIYYGWPSTFLFLMIIPIFSFLTIGLGLEESLPQSKRKKVTLGILLEYKSIITNKVFFIYTTATAMGLSYLYLFCSISSYIIIRTLNISESRYGFYFAFMGLSFFIGSFLSAYIVKRIGIYRTVVTGFIISLIGSSIMLIWNLITGLTIYNFIWPMILIGIGGTLCMGAGTGGAMEPFKNIAGAASALGGAFRFLFSSFIGAVVIGETVTSTLPLALPAFLFSIIGILAFIFYKKNLTFGALSH